MSHPTRPPNVIIRLVELQHSAASNTIECKVQTYTPAECPPYVAFSYTWGSPEIFRRIQLNRKQFLVREKLWSFLNGMCQRRCSRIVQGSICGLEMSLFCSLWGCQQSIYICS